MTNPGGSGIQLSKVQIGRFEWAAQFVKGKDVLDSGCGYGHGSFMLAQKARRVVGEDVDRQALVYARSHFNAPNLTFHETTDAKLTNFDVAVSLEVIEHVENAEAYLEYLALMLKPKGELLLSTPNKFFTQARAIQNPFHLREFYPEEMKRMLEVKFTSDVGYGQPADDRKLDSLAPYVPLAIKKLYRRLHRVEVQKFDGDCAVQLYRCVKRD